MLRVLITGIRGFTGRYLEAELKTNGYDVYGLSHHTDSSDDSQAIYTSGLDDIDQLTQLIEKIKPNLVVHLAAIAFVAHGDVESIYKTNLLGTRNLLDAIVLSNVSINAVLLASSANVYGNATGGRLTEKTLPDPANDYAVSKLAMEYMANLYRNRLPIIIARPFNYTGLGQSANFLLPKIVNHIRHNASVIELGNLDVARDFSDVRRIVLYYRHLLETPAAIGETFNICSGRAYTLEEVLDMACSIAGYEIEVKINPAFVRNNEVKTLIGSPEKLQSTVGDLPNIPLLETLRWMIEAEK